MSGLATFKYRAVDAGGSKIGGVVESLSEADAYRQLRARGLTPIAIRSLSRRAFRAARISRKDLAHFTQQLSVLIEARIPVSEGLRSLADQEPNPKLRAIVEDVARRIESGEPVAEALGAHRSAFGDLYIRTVHVAERGGTMVEVLGHLSTLLEREQETNQQIKGALMYPVVVVCILTLAVAGLVTFVVPRFATMFKSRGVDLPVVTELLLWSGEVSQAYWWAILPGLVCGAFGFVRLRRVPAYRAIEESLMHRVPYLRQILVGLALGRFTRVLAISLGAGLGLIESLEVSSRASGRAALERDAEQMVEQVRAGRQLGPALAQARYITPFCSRMLSAGERSGNLPHMCQVVARQYERDTGYLTKNIGSALEPLLIVLITGVVLVVALGIFLPMWNLVELMR